MRRILAIVIVVLVALIGAVAVFTTTAQFRSFARNQLNSFLEGSFRGTLTIGAVEGSVWGDLSLVDLTLRYHDRTLVHVPRVHLAYSFLPLLSGTLQIDELSVIRPEIRAHQDAQGRWDLLQAVSSEGAGQESDHGLGLPLGIDLDRIELVDGTVHATTADSRRYRVEDAEARAHASLGSSGVRAAVHRLDFALHLPDRPPLHADAALVYRGTAEPPVITIDRLVATTDRSRAELTGTVRWSAKPSVDARLRLAPVVASDIDAFVPSVSTETDVRGTLSVEGSLEDFHATLDLQAADGRLAADVQGDFAHRPSRFRGTASATNVHLATLLGSDRFGGVLDADLQASGEPAEPRSIQAKARVSVERLVVRDWHVENASASADVSDGRGVVDATLRDPAGAADLHGTLGLADVPTYDLRLDVNHLNPAPAFPGRGAAPGNLNLTATVEGEGLALAEMKNEIHLTIRPSKLEQVEIEHGELRARVADRRLTLEKLTLDAEAAKAHGSGVVGLEPGAPVDVSYSATVSEIRPWLALAGTSGQGRASVQGQAHGRRGDVAAEGRVRLDGLSVASVAVGGGDVRYDLGGIGGPPPVHGRVTASFTDVRARVHLRSLELKATLPDRTPQSVHLLATAKRAEGGLDRLEATVTRSPSQTEVALAALELALPDGTWTLPSPARVTVEHGAAVVDGLRLVNHDRDVKLAGRLARAGEQDFRLALTSFPLRDVAPLLSLDDLQGFVSASAEIKGSAAAPTLDASVQAKDLKLAGGTYEALSAEAHYAGGRARLSLDLRQDATHRLEAHGTLPMNVGWQPAWAMETTGPVDLEAHSSGISLAFLNALGGKTIRGAGGELTLDVSVHGPLAEALPHGTIGLHDGRVHVVSLGVDVEQIHGTAVLDGDVLRLNELAAKSGDGTLTVSAEAPLRPAAESTVNGTITFANWPAIDTRRYRAHVAGTLTAGGTLSALRLDGHLDVLDGTLRPKLDFLSGGPPARDQTITFVGGPPPMPSEREEAQPNAAPDLSGASLYQSLRMDIAVDVTRDTWIKHDGATIELRGSLHLTKAYHEQLTIAGHIETVRGWVSFQGKRFTITEGRIAFSGGREINPSLDVIASYKTGDYQVEIVIGGTVDSPTLELRSQPGLAQADILSVLLFGKPTGELNDGQRSALANRAAGIAGTYAAAQVGQSVMKKLGLENLGVQVEEMSGERLALGKYVGERTYVTVGQTLGTEPGQEVSVEYELTSNWSFVASTSTAGSNNIDLRWEKRY